jgi:hypothetical protein
MFFFYYSFFFFLVGSTWCTAKWSLGQGSQFGHHHHHHHHLMLSAFFFGPRHICPDQNVQKEDKSAQV